MAKSIQGVHIRHQRAVSDRQVVKIQAKTPFVAAAKRIKKKLAGSKHAVKLMAMGRAIQKGAAVALYYQELGYRVDVFTRTVTVLDEFRQGAEHKEHQEEDHEEHEQSQFQKRSVGMFEAHIFPLTKAI